MLQEQIIPDVSIAEWETILLPPITRVYYAWYRHGWGCGSYSNSHSGSRAPSILGNLCFYTWSLHVKGEDMVMPFRVFYDLAWKWHIFIASIPIPLIGQVVPLRYKGRGEFLLGNCWGGNAAVRGTYSSLCRSMLPLVFFFFFLPVSQTFWGLEFLLPIIWRIILSQAPTSSVEIGFEKRPAGETLGGPETSCHNQSRAYQVNNLRWGSSAPPRTMLRKE